jgi:hypothetical protein
MSLTAQWVHVHHACFDPPGPWSNMGAIKSLRRRGRILARAARDLFILLLPLMYCCLTPEFLLCTYEEVYKRSGGNPRSVVVEGVSGGVMCHMLPTNRPRSFSHLNTVPGGVLGGCKAQGPGFAAQDPFPRQTRKPNGRGSI